MSERIVNEWYTYAEAARAEEREACAKIADEAGKSLDPLARGFKSDLAGWIAAEIRART